MLVVNVRFDCFKPSPRGTALTSGGGVFRLEAVTK